MDILRKIDLKKVFYILMISCFVFLGFSFGDNIIGFTVIGIALFALLFILNFKKIRLDDLIKFVIFLIPFIAFGIISVISRYIDNEIPTLDKVFIPISLLVYLGVGFILTKEKKLKISVVLLGFCIGIALISLVNLIITCSKLGVFYNFKYTYDYLYYNGSSSNVTVAYIAYGLVGFKVVPITVQYFSLFPSLLLSLAVVIFFISPKKNLSEFIVCAVCLFIGVISLLFTINKFILVTDIFILLFLIVVALSIRFTLYKFKAFKIVLWVLLGLVILFVLLFIINAQSSNTAMHSFTSSNALFNALFNSNGIAKNLSYLLDGIFTNSKLFGFPPYYVDEAERILCVPSGNLFLDQFMYAGVFGLLFFVIVIGLSVYSLKKYLENNKNDTLDKVFILSFIGVVLCYVSFNTKAFRSPFNLISYSYSENCVWLFVVMLTSYLFVSSNEEEQNEEKE